MAKISLILSDSEAQQRACRSSHDHPRPTRTIITKLNYLRLWAVICHPFAFYAVKGLVGATRLTSLQWFLYFHFWSRVGTAIKELMSGNIGSTAERPAYLRIPIEGEIPPSRNSTDSDTQNSVEFRQSPVALPLELLSIVFACLENDPLTLSIAARVGRNFNLEAERILYSRLVVRKGGDLSTFNLVLMQKTRRQRLVRYLEVTQECYDNADTLSRQRDYETLLSLVPNVTEMVLHWVGFLNNFHETALEGVFQHPHLKSLIITSHPYHFYGSLKTMLENHPSLEKIALSGDLNLDEPGLLPLPPIKLDALPNLEQIVAPGAAVIALAPGRPIVAVEVLEDMEDSAIRRSVCEAISQSSAVMRKLVWSQWGVSAKHLSQIAQAVGGTLFDLQITELGDDSVSPGDFVGWSTAFGRFEALETIRVILPGADQNNILQSDNASTILSSWGQKTPSLLEVSLTVGQRRKSWRRRARKWVRT